jgi:hypothetical protein
VNVAIIGGSGFIGRHVTTRLVARGDEVTWLSRDPGRVAASAGALGVADVVQFTQEDAEGPWVGVIAASDTVINLAGHPIGDRWSPHTRGKIVASRVDLTRRVVDAMERERRHADRDERQAKPTTYVTTAGIGVYGDRGDDLLDESEPPGADWLAQVGALWEDQAMRAAALDKRVVVMRTGLVLGEEGLLPRFTLPMGLYVGGPVGSGRQWVPWVHIDDVARIHERAVADASMEGPYNATAPNPVTMREFARTLGRVMGRPSWARVPESALRLVVGDGAPAYVASQRAEPVRLLAAGFVFEFPQLESALRDLLGQVRA